MNETNRAELLKGYLKRLSAGEALESVRNDFAAKFKGVDAEEIMRAEQELIREGTSPAKIRKLCDLHSALFHTDNERPLEQADYTNKNQKAEELSAIPGHPLNTFERENTALSRMLREAAEPTPEALRRVREVAVHYAKKGDLLYPLLKTRYGIAGPSDVMWTNDDDIRDDLAELTKSVEADAAWTERAKAVLKRVREMIFKESKILFPICAVNFTDEEWIQIYRDSKDYANCLGVTGDIFEAGENAEAASSDARIAGIAEGTINMPGGTLTVEQLTALLNTIPLEITFVDADDINRFFNEGPKVFKRPAMALGREVYSCHPRQIEPMVRSIISEFKAGTKDSVPVWMDKNGRAMLVTYMAVRDRNKKYLGTVEAVQDMQDAKEHFLRV